MHFLSHFTFSLVNFCILSFFFIFLSYVIFLVYLISNSGIYLSLSSVTFLHSILSIFTFYLISMSTFHFDFKFYILL